jgi:ABC-type transport system involved in multi-copper enzyme maturation permease subunit
LVHSELLKLRTVWSTWLLLGITALIVLGIGAVIAVAPRGRGANLVLPPTGTAGWFDNVFSVMSVAQTFGLVLGIILVTGEFRHRTITPSLLVGPRRGQFVASKMSASAVAGLAVGVASGAAGLVLGVALVLAGNGTFAVMTGEFGRIIGGVVGASVLYALYGMGLGSLLRNQVVALVVGLAFGFVIEPIIGVALPAVGRYLPGEAALALYRSTSSAAGGFTSNRIHLLSWETAVLVLLAYAVVLAGAGALVLARTDIT